MQRHHESSAGRTVLLVLGALALAGYGVCRLSVKHEVVEAQGVVACSSLPGLAGQVCSSYHTAVGPEKFTAAAHWRQLSLSTYACSGVTMECLQEDMRSSSTVSSCRPLQEGDACDEEKQLTCSQGFCGGRPKVVQPADPNFRPGVSSGFAPVSFAPQQQQQVDESQGIMSKAKSLMSSWLQSNEPDVGAPRSLQGASAQVDPNWPTAYGTVKFRDGKTRVPETFLATSHEWTRLTDYGGENAAAWAEIFKTLSPSPVLRIGGATQDKLVDPPKDETWIALAQLQKLTNARFIIGLPLAQKNAIEMSRQMIGQAKKYLGSSVIGYELGNEPEFWPSGLGGWDEKGNWKAGFGPYSQWFDRVARTLNPCGTAAFLSGPGWGNVNTQDPNWLKIVLSNGKACGYLWEANTHYYPYIDNTTVTADQLLSQDLQDFGLRFFNPYLKIAQEGHSLPLRISEANSLYGGGRADLSDTMAGTLWVADALFAFANAGARAFHLHWGHGGLPYEGGSPNVGVQTNFDYNTPYPYKPYPSVHAPWYGYLFWVYATAGGYNKNADTQFVTAYVDKKSPSGSPAPAPAPPSSPTTASAPASTAAPSSSSKDAPAPPSSNGKDAPAPSSSPRDAPAPSSSSGKDAPTPPSSNSKDAPAPSSGKDAPAPPSNSGKDAPAPPSSSSKDAPAPPSNNGKDAPAPSSKDSKGAPSDNKGAPAPSSSSSSNASTAVVTEKGNQTGGSNSNKRLASPEAIKAWQQQDKKQPNAPAKGEQKGRRLLAAMQTGSCDANLKIWGLKSGDNTLRVAILNKDSSKSCNIKIMIPDMDKFCKEGQKAQLSRLLPGPQGMSSKSGLSWQGQHYEDSSVAASGKLVGAKEVATVTATKDADGCSYIVGMPKTSAALLVVNV